MADQSNSAFANAGCSSAKRSGRPRSLTVGERSTLLNTIPSLRRFAKSLAGNTDRADDLVQETLLRAIAKIDQFQPGTNMQAWLFTILRNLHWTECRMRRRERAYISSLNRASLSVAPAQYSALQARELQDAVEQVPALQREAILLIKAYGHSYDEAARMCRCPVGTVKSRANRARLQLGRLMAIDHVSEIGPDHRDLAVLG